MTRERDIEDYLCARVRAMRGEIRKVKWLGRNGAPDRRVMLPAGFWADDSRSFWVELKAPGKTPTAAQLREHARMQACGERVEVIDSFKRVDEVLS